MKFLHTSDWHIGKAIRQQSRLPEQEAALQQILIHAREQAVDCLLVAGDVFDITTPPPEAEGLVYRFFRELHGLGTPAVVIAGNHDHPRRLEALAPLLGSLGIHALGTPRGPAGGALIEVESRDGREKATVAALPWVNERDVVDFSRLGDERSAPLVQYEERLKSAMTKLTDAMRSDAIGILMAHLLVDEARVGRGGGERELHMNMGIYGINKSSLHPPGHQHAQYMALGHVHKAQALINSPAAWYSGSLLQLDFGEVEQEKSVNLVEVHARQPAQVTRLPITAGRRLVDVGSPERGVSLNELTRYRDQADECWFRVHVNLDIPIANLADVVRAELPSAVDVKRARSRVDDAPEPETMEQLGPVEMFQRFYESSLGRDRPPSEETLELFRRLLTEEDHALADR
jgi:DNA repair protein SbcD/Mre11